MIIRRRKDMKKFLAGKKDNKGFSLVELIVVILIMAIIAVALAPQVMKWVGKSAESTDESNAATIKASVQTAVADWIAAGKPKNDLTKTYYVVSKKGITSIETPSDLKNDNRQNILTTSSTFDDSSEGELEKRIVETMGEFPAVKTDSSKEFKILIEYKHLEKTTKVEVTYK